MKKVLYGTTALIAAGMFASAAEAAQPIKLSVGGYLNAFIAYTDIEAYTGMTQDNNKFDVATEGKIVFSGETKLDNGVKVGAAAEINLAQLNGLTALSEQEWLGDVYATVESKYGKVVIGATDNVAVMLHNVAPDASGVFGVDKSKLVNFLAVNTVVDLDSTAIDFDGNAQKITYITPKFSGFNVGASWIPGAETEASFAYNSGALDNSVDRGLAEFRSAYVLAAAYEGKFGGLELGADFAYANINAVAFNQDNGQEFSAGLKLGYAGFTFGAGYADADSGVANADNDNAWDVGIGYENGPYAVSASFFQSKDGKVAGVKGDKLKIWQVSGKYKLGAGVDAFATFGYVDANKVTALYAGKNGPEDSAWTLVTGLALKF